MNRDITDILAASPANQVYSAALDMIESLRTINRNQLELIRRLEQEVSFLISQTDEVHFKPDFDDTEEQGL